MTQQNNSSHKPTYKEYFEAFLDYLRRPKTVFDLKDRAKAAVLIGLVIIILQMVVEKLL
mgnify:FL=1